MSLEERITQDLKEAMKSRDEVTKRGIRAIKQAILLAKTDGSGDEITADLEIKMLQKLVKQRKESLEVYEKQAREDLASVEREEISVIERYLPQQMSSEELEAYLKELVAELGITSAKDMGKIMSRASAELAGRAEGKAISATVKKILG